jgi:hypothetical protein
MPIGLKGNTDGSGAVQIGGSDAITISTGLNTTFAGTVTATGTVAGSTGTLYPLVAGTAVASTSGTAIDFTGIPSWVRRITVMFSGVSTNGSSFIQLQLGDSGGVETTGYVGVMMNSGGGSTLDTAITTGFGVRQNNAGYISDGLIIISKLSGNTYVASGTLSASGAGTGTFITSGSKTLSDVLDRVRITTVNGTDTFDAGSINILYE